MNSVKKLIANQFENRNKHKSINSLKINIYKWYEVEAIALALDDLSSLGEWRFPDCLMIADSYLTTHLRRISTQLAEEELELFTKVFLDLVYEIRVAKNRFLHQHPLYLIADMPYGSYENGKLAVKNAEAMIIHGADVVKVEVSSDKQVKIIEELARRDICVMAHIGYAPQTMRNRVYGDTYDEAISIFATARKVRDSGACAIVVERVNELVNQLLCINRKNAVPIYSVFSGKTEYGGQSLNVWDAVIRPQFKARYFPLTATLDVSEFPQSYTTSIIREKFAELLSLALCNEFPLSPKNSIPQCDIEKLLVIDPWTYDTPI